MRLSAFFIPGITRHEVDDILHVDTPLTDLIAFHEGSPANGWKPLLPDRP